jgi:hypothetical protein
MLPWSDYFVGDYVPRSPATPNYMTGTAKTSFLFNQLAASSAGSGRKLILAVSLMGVIANPQVASLLVNGEPAALLYQPTSTNSFDTSFWIFDSEADDVVDVDVVTSVAVTDVVVDIWPYIGTGVAPLVSTAGANIVDGSTTTINLTAPANSIVFASENNKVPNTFSRVFALHKSYVSATALTLSSPGGASSSLSATLMLDRTTTSIFATGADIYCQRLSAIAMSST